MIGPAQLNLAQLAQHNYPCMVGLSMVRPSMIGLKQLAPGTIGPKQLAPGMIGLRTIGIKKI